MTNETATAPAQTTKQRTRKSKGNGLCECEGQPVKGNFKLPSIKADFVTGEHCEKCYTVLSHKFETIEQPKPEKIKTEKGSDKVIFSIVQVLPKKDKLDQMEFVCQQTNGKLFSITVPSTEEKVAKAMKDNSIIVGKFAVVQHNGIDETGLPINPVVIKVQKTR